MLSSEEKEQTRQINQLLCEKHPWLLPYNAYSGKLPKDYNYEYTWLDELEEGWRVAFGDQLIEDIQAALDMLPLEIRNNFRILQIKEKYAMLRIYTSPTPVAIHEVIGKYEELSKWICGRCGKRATRISTGWYYPFCDDCLKKENITNSIDIKDYYNGVGIDE